MKGKYFMLSATLCLVISLNAQESAKEAMLIKQKEYNDRTMVQRFEKTMILTAEERMKLREENRKKRSDLLVMIDTSSIIKDKLRTKLKYDVMHDPFSIRLKKFLALYKAEEPTITVAQNEK